MAADESIHESEWEEDGWLEPARRGQARARQRRQRIATGDTEWAMAFVAQRRHVGQVTSMLWVAIAPLDEQQLLNVMNVKADADPCDCTCQTY